MTRLIAILVGFVLWPCLSAASGQGPDNPRDPALNFEHVWKALDRTYAQFDVKHVDWDALYRVYQFYQAIGLYRTADLKFNQLKRDYPKSRYLRGTPDPAPVAEEPAPSQPDRPMPLPPKSQPARGQAQLGAGRYGLALFDKRRRARFG